MDDDDEFLYGESSHTDTKAVKQDQPSRGPTESVANNGADDFLDDDIEPPKAVSVPPTNGSDSQGQKEAEDDEEEEEDIDLGEDSDDDIEIILEPVNRSLDFRNQNRPQPARLSSATLPSNLPTAPRAAGLSLTTEYTPISRGGPPQPAASTVPQLTTQGEQDAASANTQTLAQTQPAVPEPDDGIDTSTLPPATAPPSAPALDVNAVGVFDGRSILEVDLSTLADKPWRRPSSDISDWFNYGFDELAWEAYCHRRRDLGELANVLKTNVINFAAMPEEQLIALPPEVRTMVMTGATAMMNNAGNPGMMGPGVMMDMSGMMGPMGSMGMNGDMAAAMNGQMMQGMMGPEGAQGGQAVGPGGQSGSAQEQVGMMQDGSGFNPANAGAGQGMINMGMGGEFVMQEQNPMVQQMYPVMEPQNVQPSMGSGRGAPAPFRSRGTPSGGVGRGGRGFPRGRGRGGIYGGDAPPAAPVRPASPLPPNVPTGPRNQNKYKDRDGIAAAVDGLDYGGGKDGGHGRRTPSGEPEERMSSRKRRSSPGLDDIRGSKRR